MGRKLDIAKAEAALLGWQLLCDKYENMDTLMPFRCPEGHDVEMTFKQWRRNPKCAICEHSSVVKAKKKNEKRVVALDAATQVSGWAIFEDGKLNSYGKFATKSEDLANRIYEVAVWLIGIIENWQPDVIVFEDIQQQNNVLTFKALAKLQGVIEYVLKEYGVEYYIVNAGTWKSYSEVHGRTRPDQKKSAQLTVEKVYKVKATQDECDAILLGRYCVDKLIKNSRMVKFES